MFLRRKLRGHCFLAVGDILWAYFFLTFFAPPWRFVMNSQPQYLSAEINKPLQASVVSLKAPSLLLPKALQSKSGSNLKISPKICLKHRNISKPSTKTRETLRNVPQNHPKFLHLRVHQKICSNIYFPQIFYGFSMIFPYFPWISHGFPRFSPPFPVATVASPWLPRGQAAAGPGDGGAAAAAGGAAAGGAGHRGDLAEFVSVEESVDL